VCARRCLEGVTLHLLLLFEFLHESLRIPKGNKGNHDVILEGVHPLFLFFGTCRRRPGHDLSSILIHATSVLATQGEDGFQRPFTQTLSIIHNPTIPRCFHRFLSNNAENNASSESGKDFLLFRSLPFRKLIFVNLNAQPTSTQVSTKVYIWRCT
jgi:hypothetical protein